MEGPKSVDNSVLRSRENSSRMGHMVVSRKRVHNELDLKSDSLKENDQFTSKIPKPDRESDDVILNRRQKQIAYGKNSEDYDKYLKAVSREERKERMPRTPNKFKKYGRRQWDGLVKNWKQKIHAVVNTMEMEVDDVTESVDVEDLESVDSGVVDDCAWKSDALSRIRSWADQVEDEENFFVRERARAGSSASLISDQGLGVSVSSSGITSPRERLDSGETKDSVFSDSG